LDYLSLEQVVCRDTLQMLKENLEAVGLALFVERVVEEAESSEHPLLTVSLAGDGKCAGLSCCLGAKADNHAAQRTDS